MGTQPIKFKESLNRLKNALKFASRAKKDPLYYDAISKAFEIALEYSWKYLKELVEEEGIDVVSPKDAIRRAGEIGIIRDVELWIGYINARNVAVHDYLGVPSADYIRIAKEFSEVARKLKQRKTK